MPKAAATARWCYATVLAVIGVVLLLMGGKLLSVGGSSYCLIAGLATLASGGLVAAHRTWLAAALYAVLLVGTSLWAIGEVGLDGWALVPRLVAPTVLGLPFLVSAAATRGWPRRGALLVALAGLLLALLAARASTPAEPPAMAFTAPPAAAMSFSSPASPPARFSPLAEVDVGNVDRLRVRWSTSIGRCLLSRRSSSRRCR